MNRIDRCFAALQQRGEKALVGFVAAGDPSPAASLEVLTAMCHAGLDVLELGVPFSDPTADGPVIQRAAARALKQGASLANTLALAASLRKKTPATPLVLFSYYNPIFAYGRQAFCRDAVAAGIDGVLVVDLPYEESGELTGGWDNSGDLALIRLIAPTTPRNRMQRIAEAASGFLYLISKAGVTGSGGLDVGAIQNRVAELRGFTRLPVCVGFGIASPAEAGFLAPHADGVVVGSAFELAIEAHLDSPRRAEALAEEVRRYKEAIRASSPGSSPPRSGGPV